MTILPYRTIRNEPGKFEEILAREGSVILNKGGEPMALVFDAGAESLESLFRLMSQVRAQLAVSRMRAVSSERGLDNLSPPEIQDEIQATRAERRG